MAEPCIVLFDGVCSFCDGFVQWVMPRDPNALCFFAASQSGAGEALRERYGITAEDVAKSIYVISGGRALRQSDAIIAIASRLRFPWRLARGLRWIPAGLRNWGYDLVSANRYRWFGKRDACRIPGPEERARFLEEREELARVASGCGLGENL